MRTPRSWRTALDACVYIPVGLVVTVVEEVPRLAERGKAEVARRSEALRVLADLATSQARRIFEDQGKASAGGLGSSMRLVREAEDARDGLVGSLRHAEGSSEMPGTASDRHGGGRRGHRDETEPDDPESGPDSEGTLVELRAHERTSGRGVDHGDLAIPGYDSLSASQVVQRLAGLSQEELAEVGDYETAHRARRTILNRVSQLQGG